MGFVNGTGFGCIFPILDVKIIFKFPFSSVSCSKISDKFLLIPRIDTVQLEEEKRNLKQLEQKVVLHRKSLSKIDGDVKKNEMETQKLKTKIKNLESSGFKIGLCQDKLRKKKAELQKLTTKKGYGESLNPNLID
jgi:hypothetical protein